MRAELACAFRWAARLDMHEGVANHFSVAVDDGGDNGKGGGDAKGDNGKGGDGDGGGRWFLMNPAGRHFARMRASDLLLLDADDEAPKGEDAPDPTAWCLHGYLHRNLPAARCVLHTHCVYATALASLAGWRLLPIDQNACRFYGRVAYDENFGGMLLAAQEAERLAQCIGDKSILVMRGHGMMVVADSIAEAFDLLYYFERSCKNQWIAMASGRELYQVPPDIAAKTAQQWRDYPASAHFAELQRMLDAEEPDYRS